MTDTGPRPHLVIVAGPNGAGKSTSAPRLLRDALEVVEFVNADAIAAGLSAFRPDSVALVAGRVMLARMRQLAAARASFAFETTLSGRAFAPWISGLRRDGYRVHLLFLRLDSADLAVGRVKARVQMGGHHIPEEIVRRRFETGLRNFFSLYLPLADTWQLFDNSSASGPRLIAEGEATIVRKTQDPRTWQALRDKLP